MIKAYASGGAGTKASSVSSPTITQKASTPRGGVSYKDLSGKLTESLKSNKSVVMSSGGDWGNARTQITRISDGEYSVSTTINWSFGSSRPDHSRELFTTMDKAIRYATKGLDPNATYKLSR